MTKRDLIVSLSDTYLIPRDKVTALLNDLTDKYVQEILTTGETRIYGIGTFRVVERAQRKGRNPKTGKPCVIPAANVLKFSTTKTLKEQLN
ncbi:HU family DNA-binding protein [Salmonella enterica]|nr:HU family DNA-binding protein [Salmonella enterica]